MLAPPENANAALAGGAAEKIQGDIKPLPNSKRTAVSQADIRLLGRYRSARAELDASLALLKWSINLREQLAWGVFDLDDARAAVADFNRAFAQHKLRRRMMA
jgi:hypothetical protein